MSNEIRMRKRAHSEHVLNHGTLCLKGTLSHVYGLGILIQLYHSLMCVSNIAHVTLFHGTTSVYYCYNNVLHFQSN